MVDAISYLRFSKKDDKKSDTIENQRTYTKQIAEYKGDNIVKDFFDEHTGKTFEGRKGWNDMLLYLETNPNIKIIYVKKIDRICRTTEGWDYQYKLIRKLDVEIYSCVESQIVNDDFLSKLHVLLAEKESKDIGIRTKIGIEQVFKKGNLIIRTPLGYSKKVIVNDDGKVLERRFVIVDDEINFVKRLFKQYFKTEKLYKTWKEFRQEGINLLTKKYQRENRQGIPTFSLAYVKDIISNTTYIGYQKHYNKEKNNNQYIKLNLPPQVNLDDFFRVNPNLKEEIEKNLIND